MFSVSLVTSPGDDISGSGSGMCVGGQCSRSRPGSYAYTPGNKRVRGAATSQSRLCSLLLLLPLAVLLLQRWWTAAASNQTLKLRVGRDHRMDKKGCGGGKDWNLTLPKNEKDILGNKWTFSLTKMSKNWQWQYSLFCFARFQFVVVWVWFVDVVICWAGFNGFLWCGRKWRRGRRRRQRREWWWMMMKITMGSLIMIYWRSGPFSSSFQSAGGRAQWKKV